MYFSLLKLKELVQEPILVLPVKTVRIVNIAPKMELAVAFANKTFLILKPMFKSIVLYLLLPIIIVFSSCGSSELELSNQEKVTVDSVASEREKSSLQRVKEEQEFLKLVAEKYDRITELKKELSKAKAMHKGAKEELAVIKEFQFGRSISTKAAQVENQCMEIQYWEEEISRIESELNQL